MAAYSQGRTVARSWRGSLLHMGSAAAQWGVGRSQAIWRQQPSPAQNNMLLFTSTFLLLHCCTASTILPALQHSCNQARPGQAAARHAHSKRLKVCTNWPTKAGRRGSLEKTGACQ